MGTESPVELLKTMSDLGKSMEKGKSLFAGKST